MFEIASKAQAPIQRPQPTHISELISALLSSPYEIASLPHSFAQRLQPLQSS